MGMHEEQREDKVPKVGNLEEDRVSSTALCSVFSSQNP